VIRFPDVVFGRLFGRSERARVRFRMRSPLVALALVSVAGCHAVPTRAAAPAATKVTSSSGPVARPAPASAAHPDRLLAREVLAAIGRFTDEACACADASCVGEVQMRMGAWAKPRLPRIQLLKPTEAENAAAEALQVRMQSCLARHEAPPMLLTGRVVLDQLAEWKTQICACTDQACVQGVQEQMMTWAAANLDAMKGLEPTADEDAEADRIDSELNACIARIESSAR
jgi:hypothetical protein